MAPPEVLKSLYFMSFASWSTAFDFNPSGIGLGQGFSRHRKGQNALFKPCFHGFLSGILGQREHPLERTIGPFHAIVVSLLFLFSSFFSPRMVNVSWARSSLTSSSSTPGISMLMVYSLSEALKSSVGLSISSKRPDPNGRSKPQAGH